MRPAQGSADGRGQVGGPTEACAAALLGDATGCLMVALCFVPHAWLGAGTPNPGLSRNCRLAFTWRIYPSGGPEV